jgi:glycosyltransferase involved in cell wall biosynthesis
MTSSIVPPHMGWPRPRRPATGYLLQVPELCGWNPYVGLAETSLAPHGYRAIRPGLCRDTPGSVRPKIGTIQPRPHVVHLHWPEKLARELGAEDALALLERLSASAAIVQTLHNLIPHEQADAEPTASFLRAVDELCVGVHLFSVAHQQAARAARPGLPTRALHLAHPRYPDLDAVDPATPTGTLGCFGRLRAYKRIAEFARVFLDCAGPGQRLLVAGHPDDPRTHDELGRLAVTDTRLVYRPGFHDRAHFIRLLGSVEWVALPYEQVWSSGVLVSALQLGRRLLSPTPVGGLDLYGDVADWWVTVDPWDHETAVLRWLEAAALAPAAAPGRPDLALPTWQQAASEMAAWYRVLLLPPSAGGADRANHPPSDCSPA